MGRSGGGQVFSVLAFYSDDTSSNSAEVYLQFSFCKWVQIPKNEKEAGVDPFKKTLVFIKNGTSLPPFSRYLTEKWRLKRSYANETGKRLWNCLLKVLRFWPQTQIENDRKIWLQFWLDFANFSNSLKLCFKERVRYKPTKRHFLRWYHLKPIIYLEENPIVGTLRKCFLIGT